MEMTQEKINQIEHAVVQFFLHHEDRIMDHVDGFQKSADVQAMIELDRMFLDGQYFGDLEPETYEDSNAAYLASREREAIKDVQKWDK